MAAIRSTRNQVAGVTNANGITRAASSKFGGERRIFGDITNVNRNNMPAASKQGKPGEKVATRPTTRAALRAKDHTKKDDVENPAQKPTTVKSQKLKQEKQESAKQEVKQDDEDMDVASDLLDQLDLVDIDANDLLNPLLCAEYVKDIYNYLNMLEEQLQPGDYFLLGSQSEINVKMRSILVDWLIQVQTRFNLLQETLYLTVHLIDRYLAVTDICRSDLQLVGVTAMLLASKYEEMYAPEIGDFVYITDNAYTKTKIRSMEQKMLIALDFDLSNPLCLHFLRRCSKAGEVNAQTHTLAKYLMELSLVDYHLATTVPSKVAAASLCLSLKLTDARAAWSPQLERYSGYTEQQIAPTLARLAHQVVRTEQKGCKYEAVKNKYAASKFMRISTLPELKGRYISQLAAKCTVSL